MSSITEKSNQLSEHVIGSAIAVHRALGPGLLESLYQGALCIELEGAGIAFELQKKFPVLYKGHLIGDLRVDLIIENELMLELKSVERRDPLFEAQLLTYLRFTGIRTGLLINFNSRLLKEGIQRFVL